MTRGAVAQGGTDSAADRRTRAAAVVRATRLEHGAFTCTDTPIGAGGNGDISKVTILRRLRDGVDALGEANKRAVLDRTMICTWSNGNTVAGCGIGGGNLKAI
jgi:hypothetical protein